LAGSLGRDEAAVAGGFHAILQKAARGGVNTNVWLPGDKRIDALCFAHILLT
jgi:hypothetical protein